MGGQQLSVGTNARRPHSPTAQTGVKTHIDCAMVLGAASDVGPPPQGFSLHESELLKNNHALFCSLYIVNTQHQSCLCLGDLSVRDLI